MNNKEKLSSYNKLKAPQHLEKDLELLKKNDPGNHLLKNTFRPGDKYANEVLYVLLDHASHEEIVKNRRENNHNPLIEFDVTITRIKDHFLAFGVDGDDEGKEKAAAAILKLLPIIPEDIQKHIPGDIKGFSFELIQKWSMKYAISTSARKAALLHKTPTPEGRKKIMDEIIDLIKDLPEEFQETALKLPKSICEKMDNAVKANTEAADLILEQKENLEKKEESIQEQQTALNEKKEEVAELKGQLEESEYEKEDLEEKTEKLEKENEKLMAEKVLQIADLTKISYNEKKTILFDLNLNEGLENLKDDTITPVLQKKQDELLAVAAGGQKKS